MLDQVVIATSNQSHHCTILLILKVKIALGSKKKFLMCIFSPKMVKIWSVGLWSINYFILIHVITL